MTGSALGEGLGAYATPTLFEAARSLGVTALPPAIKPLFIPIGLCGPAYPVTAPPGDNAAVHVALALAPPGAVLVVAIGGDLAHAFWGEIMMEAALARGIRGLVTDGAVRDSRALRERRFPIFCAGIAIPGTGKLRQGAQNAPLTIGQATVRPGDWIAGDDDGVVIVPQEQVASVLGRAQARVEQEAAMIDDLRRGRRTVDLLGLSVGEG